MNGLIAPEIECFLSFGLGLQGLPIQVSFLASIRSTLLADSSLMAMLPGGIWHKEAPPARSSPWAVFFIVSSSDELIDSLNFYQTGQVQFSVFSSVAQTARIIADTIDDDLSNIVIKKAVTWKNGRLQYLVKSNTPNTTGPNEGFGGVNITGEIRIFDYQYHGRKLA